ncbi:protein-tyrosine sulfotransferase 1-like [Gigantopelta aegis]|uniref:protein-tyrosine sulfotransferase 1-like n=1 Tax=Gigantopelta aegis TaxID=1735272 RepID=UPI001B88DF58|nr:protein-tyrosine sulfotransferase 1-like [Gigantopelta aegis]
MVKRTILTMCMRSAMRKKFYFTVFLCFMVMSFVYFLLPCNNTSHVFMVPRDPVKYIYDDQNQAIPYDANMDIVFIGGMPRSGTTLMRAMIDAHPDVRCGEETRVIPRILGMRTQWEKSSTEKKRLLEAGVTGDVIDSAVRSFILEIIAKHGEAAPRLCNKDPFSLKSAIYLSRLFPNAKFLLLVRDGRAVVHSIITRKVTISGFDIKSYRKCLQKWNTAVESMYGQCLRVGQYRCMPVYYEQLVLHPELWMRRILQFLNLPWNQSVLHHEEFIGKKGGISLSRTEKSTDQVIKPVNMQALSKWVGHIPADVIKDMATVAPMLQVLGYDPDANPPNYGNPDPEVADNTLHVQKNQDFWQKRERDIFDKLPDNRSVGAKPLHLPAGVSNKTTHH